MQEMYMKGYEFECRFAEYLRRLGVDYRVLGGNGEPDGVIGGSLYVEVTHREPPHGLRPWPGEPELCKSVSPELIKRGLWVELERGCTDRSCWGHPRDADPFKGTVSRKDEELLLRKAIELADSLPTERPQSPPPIRWLGDGHSPYVEIAGRALSMRVGRRRSSYCQVHEGHDTCAFRIRPWDIGSRDKSVHGLLAALEKKLDQHKDRSRFQPYLVVLYDYWKVMFDDEAVRMVSTMWDHSYPRSHVVGVLVFHHPDDTSVRPVLVLNTSWSIEDIRRMVPVELMDACVVGGGDDGE